MNEIETKIYNEGYLAGLQAAKEKTIRIALLDLNTFKVFPDGRIDDAQRLARKINEIIEYLTARDA